ncbi:MAG TPA: crosslink repair DNA glycosylase YcaQ family protein [Candidatus Sulfotelmatobacter sp.]|nr:crosslink repair DNA glycosylase YcaQ family protein [Candidatus Sulfotelmatobacter sp.]
MFAANFMAKSDKRTKEQSVLDRQDHASPNDNVLGLFHPAVKTWFSEVFEQPTRPQRMGWPAIARSDSTLILAPTGTGKTLAAFLWCLNRLMFSPVPEELRRCRVLYISPIKALAVDVERNLQSPLVGITQTARRMNLQHFTPNVAIRTGDTPSAQRSRFLRHPSDILVTTPESLYLLLTSNAREVLASIETVIIDEIHALVPNKRGSHLALSLERLEHLCQRRLQRIGLSATQRPLEEVSHFLGGLAGSTSTPEESTDNSTQDVPQESVSEFESSRPQAFRPVTIVDASEPKKFALKVEVPVDDMSRLDELEPIPSGPASQGPVRASIWSAIHPKLLELVKAHRSTLLFVNSRRLAERIAGAINELAGETLVRAHHGSMAAEQRKDIEDRLKLGSLRGLVATSSLELGIDMGAIDLVVLIESPPSVASGMQRVGRASHHVGAISTATVFPKYRADLLACAAITKAMYDGEVESVRYPRNPLDVLAQQIVAMVSMDPWEVNELFSVVRQAAPFGGLTRGTFDGVLDMLSGRYPSEEFAELRPRLTWDRIAGKLTTREGARRVAVINGGTIPDRGLYGVFLTGATKGARVGELDEEMVFESRTGDTIILGATTWRIDEILPNKVSVSPAPGEPGKMPFWKGDGPGRPAEFGEKIGRLTRQLLAIPRPVALSKLIDEHSLDENAAENLIRYLEDQKAATQYVPSDQDILIEIVRDELGDRRICVLTPFGNRVHAPWCMAVDAKIRAERGWEVESLWSDDGFVIRLPGNEEPVDTSLLLPTAAELKDLVLRELGSTSLFAAKFREASARALLLPKRRAGQRAPLWQTRKRAADLLAVASRYSSFPILLESYRECVRDTFDLAGTTAILAKIGRGEIRVTMLEPEKPSPFASSLLFSYVANYIYDGDAPLAERRAQALSIDQSQLEELLGDNDLRELLDPAAIEEVETRLQMLDQEYHARSEDAIHDMLLRLGDLTEAEISSRSSDVNVANALASLSASRRILKIRIKAEPRYIPVEYAARYRDAFGVPLPPGLAEVFLKPADDPLSAIMRRYSRTHGPFTVTDISKRYALEPSAIEAALQVLHAQGKLLEGEFLPKGSHREWCDPEVLQQIRRKSLSNLRKEIEPVEQQTLARLLSRWQGVHVPRKGLDALLDAIEILQGASLLASDLEREILPARVAGYQPGDLDTLMAAGEVVWTGVEQVGDHDGRVALYLTEALPMLAPPAELIADRPPLSERAAQIMEFLAANGASFFPEIRAACGGGFPGDVLDALWELVWRGEVTNDTFHTVRSRLSPASRKREHREGPAGSPEFLRRLRARKNGDGIASGRWSLLRNRRSTSISVTEWSANTAQQLLTRYGIVTRETALAEAVPGGYNTIYPALKRMEESGYIRRGMFVAGLGAAQFAMPAAVDMLRTLRSTPNEPESVVLAATDPANPYGSVLPWTVLEGDNNAAHAMARASGASVVLVNGMLTAYLRRKNPSIRVFLPEAEPERSQFAARLARQLAELAVRRQKGSRTGILISQINDIPAREHPLGRFLEEAGFSDTANGYHMRRMANIASTIAEEEEESDIPDNQSTSESA